MVGTGGRLIPAKLQFGPYEADLCTRELRKFGIRVKLQDQPFTLLAALLERPGEVLGRDEIRKRIWGDTVVGFEHSLGTALNKLREALGDSPERPLYIETLPRKGYRFIAPVRTVESPCAPLTENSIHVSSPEGPIVVAQLAPPSISGAHRPVDSARAWYAGVVAACVLMAFAAAGWMWNRPPALVPIRYGAITSSGHVYDGVDSIESIAGMRTDGVHIYFSENRNGKIVLVRASVSGGQPQMISTPPEILRPLVADISADGSKLLVRSRPVSELEGPLWIVPSSGGAAERVPNILGHAASWLPDATGILYATGHDLMLVRSLGRASEKLATVPGRAFEMRYSPDGSILRFTVLDSATRTTSLWQMSADGRKLRRLLQRWRDAPAECCGGWTADGSYYVFESTRSGQSDIWALDETWGWAEHPIQLTAGPLSYRLPATAAGGRVFVIGTRARSQLVRVGPSSGRPEPWPANVDARRIGFSRDRLFAAWTGFQDGLLFRSGLDGSQTLRLTPPSVRTARLAWSPDGKYLAFDGREHGGPSRIYIVPSDGGPYKPVLEEERGQTDPNWSPDGKTLLFGRLPNLGEDSGDKAIYMVDLASQKTSVLPGSNGLFSPRWSPDGQYIAAMPLRQDKLFLLEVSSGRWDSVDVPGIAASPTWSNDSKYVYYKDQREGAVYRLLAPTERQPRVQRVAGMEVIEPADTFNLVGVSPDDSPLLLTLTSTADIYFFDWGNR